MISCKHRGMNWYTCIASAFVDTIIPVAGFGARLVLFVNGKRYVYEGLQEDGQHLYYKFEALKKQKNKRDASSQASALVKRLEPFRVKDKNSL